ncbi:MAG: T9SS type B sorting domain-containing protein, partial [Paludibacteraceae bacterium]|nr:T9SS type B sorting domain-containing protein [Paludibacteraceae bacterium]
RMTVTVYPKPVQTITDPDAVCETSVDLSKTVAFEKEVGAAAYATKFYSDAAGTAEITSAVEESGTYYAQTSFATPTATIAGSVCKSTVDPIKVTVETLELTPVVDAETCPNTEGLLHAEVATNVASASFSWAAQASSDAKIDVQSVAGGAAQSDFTTTKLLGDAGTVFLYDLTVSAGTCSETQTGIKVTLGDGPVVGTLTLTEDENANSGKIYTSTRDVTADPFYMCGSGVTATAALEKDADSEFQWTNAAGSSVGTGSSVTINTAGIYTITYSNNCATSMTFEVKDASIKNNVAIFSSKDLKASDDETLVICENEPVSVQLTYTAGNDASTVEWAKDDAPTSVVSGTTTSIAKATPDMSGVYKYTITNYGCEATGSVEAKVKPYIRFKPEQDLYIARRDSLLEIPTIISVPAAGTPSSISWTNKAGSEVNTTKDYLYTVDASDVFTITMSDDNYCDTTKTVEVIKDARLQLETSIDEKMCRGDKGVYLTIDTTGTGAIYYTDKAFITVTETIGEASHNISGWKLVDGKLQLEVHPTADATYTTTFLYREGEGVDEQKVVSETSIIVLQPIQIKVPTGLSVCAGDELEISLLSVTPEGSVVVNWQDDATITSGTSDTETITVVPEYDEETGRNHNSTKVYHLTASMEGCADKTEKVTITVNEPITGTLFDTTICEGFGVRLDASNYKAATYEWTSALVGNALGNSQTLYVTPEETSTYTVSMTRGNCKAEAEMTINVNSNPKIVSVDSLGCRKVQITLDESYGTAPYYYAVDDVSTYDLDPVKDGLKYTIHTAYVKDAVGCVAVAPFVVEQPTIIFPVWFSPNGDDVSGVWSPVNIQETYPEAEIRIFNRYGKEVGTFLGADPGWDGVYNGVDQPSTDYWFEVTVHEIDKVFTGHFTLIRR